MKTRRYLVVITIVLAIGLALIIRSKFIEDESCKLAAIEIFKWVHIAQQDYKEIFGRYSLESDLLGAINLPDCALLVKTAKEIPNEVSRKLTDSEKPYIRHDAFRIGMLYRNKKNQFQNYFWIDQTGEVTEVNLLERKLEK